MPTYAEQMMTREELAAQAASTAAHYAAMLDRDLRTLGLDPAQVAAVRAELDEQAALQEAIDAVLAELARLGVPLKSAARRVGLSYDDVQHCSFLAHGGAWTQKRRALGPLLALVARLAAEAAASGKGEEGGEDEDDSDSDSDGDSDNQDNGKGLTMGEMIAGLNRSRKPNALWVAGGRELAAAMAARGVSAGALAGMITNPVTGRRPTPASIGAAVQGYCDPAWLLAAMAKLPAAAPAAPAAAGSGKGEAAAAAAGSGKREGAGEPGTEGTAGRTLDLDRMTDGELAALADLVRSEQGRRQERTAQEIAALEAQVAAAQEKLARLKGIVR